MTDGDGAAEKRTAFAQRYARALGRYLRQEATPAATPARRLGRHAVALGMETLELAGVHQGALTALPRPQGKNASDVRRAAARAKRFFAQAVEPIEETHGPAVRARSECVRLTESGRLKDARLAATKRQLADESKRRKAAQKSLVSSASDHRDLLLKARTMEEELRRLSHRLLTSHEEERKRISRELHDALGQTLTAINVGLASLQAAEAADSAGFLNKVARTQRLVQQSMRTVHQFARDLRPKLLDDLGLVPALTALVRDFGKRNSLDAKVTAPALPEELSGDHRTALFRVAQEALLNVSRHAQAKSVRVSLRMSALGVRLRVWNDGGSFDVSRAQKSGVDRHLGILCMRERMEMVGGSLSITSSKRKGTAVVAEIPLPEDARG